MEKSISKHYRDLPTCSIIGSYVAKDGDGNVGQILCRSKSGDYIIFAWEDPGTSYCENGEPGVICVNRASKVGALIWAVHAGISAKAIEKEFLSKEVGH